MSVLLVLFYLFCFDILNNMEIMEVVNGGECVLFLWIFMLLFFEFYIKIEEEEKIILRSLR